MGPGLGSDDLVEIAVVVDGEAAEAVCELFERLGGGAVVETRLPDDATLGEPLPLAQTTARTYLAAGDVAARTRIEVGLWHLGQLYPIPEASVRHLAQADWAEAWKVHYSAQRIGAHFLIVPSWLEARPEPGEVVLRLDPGSAFGTGLHPTTRLCLTALESLVTPGESVLDVGTGSGILAIGAAKLGALRVVALDIDPAAVTVALENGALNGVALATHSGELASLAPERFDVVVANLLAGPIIALAASLAARLRPGGALCVSGILASQAEAVTEALVAAGLAAPTLQASGDWVAIGARLGADGPTAR